MTAIKVASDLKIFSDNRVIMCDIVDNKISIVAYEKDLKEYEKYKEGFVHFLVLKYTILSLILYIVNY